YIALTTLLASIFPTRRSSDLTHDRYFLDQIATEIMELSFGSLYSYTGNYQDFVRQKAERVERELVQEHKQQQLYKKELAWMRTGDRKSTRLNSSHVSISYAVF